MTLLTYLIGITCQNESYMPIPNSCFQDIKLYFSSFFLITLGLPNKIDNDAYFYPANVLLRKEKKQIKESITSLENIVIDL